MSNNEEPRLSDFLSGLREKGDGFQSPAPDFLDEIASRAITEAARPAVVRPLYRTWLAAAAAVLLLLLAGTFLLPSLTDEADGPAAAASNVNYNSEALLADLDPAVIDAYIADQLDEFETELYASAPLK